MTSSDSQRREYLKEFIAQYNKKTLTSKIQASRSRHSLADPRGIAGFKFSSKELLYPIIAKYGKGSRFFDLDDNEYVDISMGFGALLFGHMPDFIKSALLEQIERGTQLGPQADLVCEVTEMICELTGVERVAFCNTGTEAVMMALRLARLKSGKEKIAMFAGAYHGFYEATLGLSLDSKIDKVRPISDGLPNKIFQDILVLEYNNAEHLEILASHVNDLAAIIIEPVQGRSPGLQEKYFLELIRAFCTKNNVILIFDEIVTGFRCHPGGCQAYFSLEADLVIYGKALAGGLPIGVVAGKKEIMEGVDGGAWEYGDTSYPKANTTFFAGTFNKNPLTIATTHAFLKELKKQGPDLQLRIENKTKYVTDELNNYFQSEDIPISLARFSSLFRFNIKSHPDILFYHLIFNNLYVWEGRSFYISEAHTPEDLNFIIDTVKATTTLLRSQGFIPSL